MTKIMTVDDSRLVRSIITACLGECGYETVEAENGEEAFELLKAGSFDLVFLDVMMPVMDGPAMLERLRMKGDETPVILLTSKTESAVITSCMKHNIADYIVKPVRTDELMAKTARVLGIENPGPSDRTREEEGAEEVGDSVLDLLLVDDSEKVAAKFGGLLPEKVNYKNCVNSEEATIICRDFKKVRTVVLDMVIPNEDSLELAGALRLIQPKARYFALYLRNVSDPVREAYNAGFDGSLVKPFQKEQIQDLVRLTRQSSDSFDEILKVDENILCAQPSGASDERHEEYYARMAELVGTVLEQMASDCVEDVTFDFTELPESELMPMLIGVALQCCEELGISVKMVGSDFVRDVLGKTEQTVSFFSTVEAAQEEQV